MRKFANYTAHAVVEPRLENRVISAQKMVRVNVGDVGEAVMPYSEVCMHMRVAGKKMGFKVLDNRMVQLMSLPDMKLFSAPITLGEAGIYEDNEGMYYYPNGLMEEKYKNGNHFASISPEAQKKVASMGLNRVAGNVYECPSTRDFWAVRGNKIVKLVADEAVDDGSSIPAAPKNRPMEFLTSVLDDLTL